MRIFVVQSPYDPTSKLWTEQRDLIGQHAEIVGADYAVRSEDSFEKLIPEIDGIVAEISERNATLEANILRAHTIGKGVLLFLPNNQDPNELLPALGPHPVKEDAGRAPISYWINKTDVRGNEIAVHRGAMRQQKLKLWLASQAMRARSYQIDDNDGFMIETPDGKRHGAEADNLPEA